MQTTFADANQYMKDGVLLRQVINVIDELDLSDYEESHAFGEIYETILKELQSAGSAGEFYTPRAVTDFMAQVIQPADRRNHGGLRLRHRRLYRQLAERAEKAGHHHRCRGGLQPIPSTASKKSSSPICSASPTCCSMGWMCPGYTMPIACCAMCWTIPRRIKMDVVLMNPPYGGSEKAEVKNHFPADLASSETADLFMSVIMYRLKQERPGRGNPARRLPVRHRQRQGEHQEANCCGSSISIPSSACRAACFLPIRPLPPTSCSSTIPTPPRKPGSTGWICPQGYKHFSKTKPMKPEHFQPGAGLVERPAGDHPGWL